MKISYKCLASFEPTPLLAAAGALLGRLGISLLDDFREWPPEILARHQAMLQPLDEGPVLLRHPALLRGLHRGDLAALGGW
jgi:hypothetical protein